MSLFASVMSFSAIRWASFALGHVVWMASSLTSAVTRLRSRARRCAESRPRCRYLTAPPAMVVVMDQETVIDLSEPRPNSIDRYRILESVLSWCFRRSTDGQTFSAACSVAWSFDEGRGGSNFCLGGPAPCKQGWSVLPRLKKKVGTPPLVNFLCRGIGRTTFVTRQHIHDKLRPQPKAVGQLFEAH